jgi:hypothetical protein
MPHRNRVTPEGEIVAIPLRGAWTGNRGNLHGEGTDILRQWASHHWLCCALEYKDWHQEQWLPRRLTWLFFHDEAVALAAGHRPCALCRRPAYNAYRAALGEKLSHDQLDRRLHAERRRTHEAAWASLPDGAFVAGPALILGDRLVSWTTDGYGDSARRPRFGTADVLTPATSLAVLRAGYEVQIGV